jgi:polysaccharide pyruvyl transferase WcaK-like protein
MLKKDSQKKKSVVIKGAYGCGNFGDDALMIAVYEITKQMFEPQHFLFVCRNANYISKLLPSAEVVLQNSLAAQSAEVFVYGGGTQFFSFPLTNQSGSVSLLVQVARNLLKPFQLWQKIVNKISALVVPMTKQQVVALGVGLGPFNENCRGIQNTKTHFARMKYVAVRDISSYSLCTEWDCEKLFLRSDLCYLPGLWRDYLSNVQLDNKDNKLRKVGVIVRDWSHTKEGDSYADSLFRVVDELRSTGKEVNFISFDNESVGAWPDRLRRRNEKAIRWNPDKDSIEGFLEMLSGYDAFITSRFHGAIFASILSKPVVCIEIEQKLRLVSEIFGEGARLWTYPFSTSECLKHIKDLEVDYTVAAEYLKRVVEEQGVLVEKMINEYHEVVSTDSL